jgi:hypothetical protein
MDLEWPVDLDDRSLGISAVRACRVGSRQLGSWIVWLAPDTRSLAVNFPRDASLMALAAARKSCGKNSSPPEEIQTFKTASRAVEKLYNQAIAQMQPDKWSILARPNVAFKPSQETDDKSENTDAKIQNNLSIAQRHCSGMHEQ